MELRMRRRVQPEGWEMRAHRVRVWATVPICQEAILARLVLLKLACASRPRRSHPGVSFLKRAIKP